MSNPDTSASSPDPESAPVGAPRQSSLLRSSAIMASGTMVSRILGFVRVALLAGAIGAAGGGVFSAFQVANTLPNTVYNVLAAGVFDAVLVPQIVRALKRTSGDVYVNRLITLAGTILFGVTLIAMVLAPLLVTITAAAYDSEMRSLTIAFTLLCLPQIFFYGLYNLLGEVLNARGIFGPYMWAPVVNNIVGIGGLVAFLALWGSRDSVFSIGDFTDAQFWVLAGSATLGVICQALVLIIPLRKSGVKLRPDFRFRGTSFGSASRVAGWTFATLGISQVGVLSTSNLASAADAFAKTNDVIMAGYPAYTTAFMIYMVPQSLISVTLATAIFTRLAHAAANRDHQTVAEHYHSGVRLITMLSLLSAAILMAGAVPMMQLVLPGSDPAIVREYAWVLVALMPGVASTGMVLMSQRVFFAYEDAKPVFLMGIIPTIFQVIVGWSFFFLADAHLWTIGAALGETACRILQGFIAVVWVARKNRWVNPGMIIASYIKYFIAALVSLGVGILVILALDPITLNTPTLVRILVALIKVSIVALFASAAYLLVLRIIDPLNSQRMMAFVAGRLPLPGFLKRLLGAEAVSIAAPDGDNVTSGSVDAGGVMGQDPSRDDLPADSDADELPPTPEEREDSENASRTGWSMIGRQWNASDPTHTGEFPIVPPPPGSAGAAAAAAGAGAAAHMHGDDVDRMTKIPSFNEILHPSAPPPPAVHIPFPPAPGEAFTPTAGEELASALESATMSDSGEGESEPLIDEDGAPLGDSDAEPSVEGVDAGEPSDFSFSPPPMPDADHFSVSPDEDWPHAPIQDLPGDVSGGQGDLDSQTAHTQWSQAEAAAHAEWSDEGPLDSPTSLVDDDADRTLASDDPATLTSWPAEVIGWSGVADHAEVLGSSDEGGSAEEGEELTPGMAEAAGAGIAGATAGGTAGAAQGAGASMGAAAAGASAALSAAGLAIAGASKSVGSWLSRTGASIKNAVAPSSTTAGDGTAEPHGATAWLDEAEAKADKSEPPTQWTPLGGIPRNQVPSDSVPPAPPAAPPLAPGVPPVDAEDTWRYSEAVSPSLMTSASAGAAMAGVAAAPSPGGPGEPGGQTQQRSQRGRIDPTIPTLIFALILVITGGVWGVQTFLAPTSGPDLAQSLIASQSGAQSGAPQDVATPPEGEPAPVEGATPVVSSLRVLSWRDDGGDHEDLATDMIDGDPETGWRSRYYDLNQFDNASTVTILIRLEQPATVHRIHMTMDPATTGGEAVVRVVNPDTPREGTEIAISALSGQTVIELPEPAHDVQALSVSFRAMPTDSEGRNRAWVYELSVE